MHENEQKKIRKINLGCGTDIIDGFENYDLFPVSNSVRKLDLHKLPYTFEKESVDYILLSHVLEHMTVYKFDVVKECHRILKTDGILEIRLPINCNIIQHTQAYFDKNYLDGVFKGSEDNLVYCPKLFSLLSFSINYIDKKEKVLGRLLQYIPFFKRLRVFLYGEYVWKLKKKRGKK